MASFSVSLSPTYAGVSTRINGGVSVTVSDESAMNYAHLRFETPIEAWQWASKLALEIEKQMTPSEVTE